MLLSLCDMTAARFQFACDLDCAIAFSARIRVHPFQLRRFSGCFNLAMILRSLNHLDHALFQSRTIFAEDFRYVTHPSLVHAERACIDKRTARSQCRNAATSFGRTGQKQHKQSTSFGLDYIAHKTFRPKLIRRAPARSAKPASTQRFQCTRLSRTLSEVARSPESSRMDTGGRFPFCIQWRLNPLSTAHNRRPFAMYARLHCDRKLTNPENSRCPIGSIVNVDAAVMRSKNVAFAAGVAIDQATVYCVWPRIELIRQSRGPTRPFLSAWCSAAEVMSRPHQTRFPFDSRAGC